MVLNQINQDDLFKGILMQLARAVAERNYMPPNIREQHSNSNNPRKRFVKASQRNHFRIGMFRTTQQYYCGIEEIIAEDASIVHENIQFTKPIRKQKLQCKMKELQDLKQAIDEIINNILP